jgi:hypothetical protein
VSYGNTLLLPLVTVKWKVSSYLTIADCHVDQPCGNNGGKEAICVQIIGMFIHFCSDRTSRSEGSSAAVCLSLELFCISGNTGC